MDISGTLLALIVSTIVICYLYLKRKYEYWEKRKIPHLKPLPLAGNLMDVILFRKSTGEVYKEAYEKFPNEKVVGIYELLKPALIVRDPKLIEKILIKDFQYFINHSKIIDENSLFAHGLFQMRDQKWRTVRAKVSPAFTSGKLKMMFNTMIECADQLVEAVNKNLNKDYEIRNDVCNYTMDVISNSVFGIKISDKRSKEEFTNMANSIFEVKPIKFLEIFLVINAPKLAHLLGLKFMSNEATQYFKGLIKSTFEQRKNTNYKRNDYVQQLLNLKEQGYIDIQANEEEDDYLDLNGKVTTDSVEITDDLLTGQAFQFLSAGFDPVYITLLLAILDLACNIDVQEKSRNQIKEVLKKHGSYTYDAVKDMTYLEQCVQETLRLHPLVSFLFRECTKTYKTDDGLTIEKGQKVIIALNALHHDPKYYPEPEIFNPDRLPSNSSRNNFTYMPFGDGPRMCIGLRFALVELKIVLAKLLDNFKITLSPQTKLPFEVNKQSFILYPKSKILFNMTAIK